MKRNNSYRTKHRRQVTWDEENLETNETLRIPRQKIPEPKTPFHQLSLDSEDADWISTPSTQLENEVDELVAESHAAAIAHALSEVASSSENSLRHENSGNWISEDEISDIDQEGDFMEGHPNAYHQTQDFKDHRKKHYDEYRKLKLLLAKGCSLPQLVDGDEVVLEENSDLNSKEMEKSAA